MARGPIGVLGAGPGAFRLASELHRALPGSDILYLECLHPHGAIDEQVAQGARLLREQGAAMLVLGSAAASAALDERRMDALCAGLPHTGVLMPAVRSACALSARGAIGAVAQPDSLRSGFFGRAARAVRPDCRVFGGGCEDAGALEHLGDTARRQALSAWIEPLLRENIDTLLLGDTQLGAFCGIMNELFSHRVTLIDCVRETVQHVCAALVGNRPDHGGTLRRAG